MDSLRWVLLIIGVIVFLLIYIISKRKSAHKLKHDAYQDLDDETIDDMVITSDRMVEMHELDDLAKKLKLEEDRSPATASETSTSGLADEPEAVPAKQDLIAFYLVERDKLQMPGSLVVEALEKSGMRYGDMKIFHFHNPENPGGPTLFSIANMVEPGTFDLISLNSMSTPGLALFMNLPAPVNNLQAFDYFISIIDQLKELLPVELRDQKHNKISAQALTHMREQMAQAQLKNNIKK